MKIENARHLNSKELYERRKQAVMLYRKGMKRREIAPIVGATAYTVGQWVKAWKEGSLAALKVGDKGRPKGIGRKLLPHEEQQVRKDITDKCPEELKLSFALWTRQAVQVLIKQNYSVELTLQAVGNYLKRWGFSPQKPIRRAYERNDECVWAWLQDEYPAIASKAKKENAEIHWGDETGLRSDAANGRSYSPKGKTPVQKVKGTPEKLNMVSHLHHYNTTDMLVIKQGNTAERFAGFMKDGFFYVALAFSNHQEYDRDLGRSSNVQFETVHFKKWKLNVHVEEAKTNELSVQKLLDDELKRNHRLEQRICELEAELASLIQEKK